MNLKERLLELFEAMKRQPYNPVSNLWGDVPEDPQERETQLIGAAMFAGFSAGVAIACAATEHFLFSALLLVSAATSGYRVTKLSIFGSRFRGKNSILAKPAGDGRSGGAS